MPYFPDLTAAVLAGDRDRATAASERIAHELLDAVLDEIGYTGDRDRPRRRFVEELVTGMFAIAEGDDRGHI